MGEYLEGKRNFLLIWKTLVIFFYVLSLGEKIIIVTVTYDVSKICCIYKFTLSEF